MNEKLLFKTLNAKMLGQPDQKISPIKLVKIIRELIGSHDIHVIMKRHADVDLGTVIVTGAYDRDEDEAHYPNVNIFVNFHTLQQTLQLSPLLRKQLCIDIVENLGHQLIHQTQYRSRNFEMAELLFVSNSAEQEYLGNPDEIEAYGYSVAVTTFFKFPPIHVCGVLTGKMLTKNMFARSYVEHFGINHPITIKLIEYAVRYYRQLLENGKIDRIIIPRKV